MSAFRRFRVGRLIFLMLVLAVGLTGCRGAPRAGEVSGPAERAVPRVTLAAGDELEIKFFYAPELNESQTVRPDGRIALQLVREVYVVGKTPAQLGDELARLYGSHLKQPEVTVIVRALAGQRVYVGGEVNRPGAVPMPGALSAFEAIMEAGGFNMQSAKVENVVVIRHRNGRRSGIALDLEKALAGKSFAAFPLEPNDIVYVPRTRIAKVDQWIEQHINRIVPQFGFVYTTPVGTGTVGVDTSR